MCEKDQHGLKTKTNYKRVMKTDRKEKIGEKT